MASYYQMLQEELLPPPAVVINAPMTPLFELTDIEFLLNYLNTIIQYHKVAFIVIIL